MKEIPKELNEEHNFMNECKVLQNLKFKIKSPVDTNREYIGVLFSEQNFCLANLIVHSTLIGIEVLNDFRLPFANESASTVRVRLVECWRKNGVDRKYEAIEGSNSKRRPLLAVQKYLFL